MRMPARSIKQAACARWSPEFSLNQAASLVSQARALLLVEPLL
jgi:hypothetical protein